MTAYLFEEHGEVLNFWNEQNLQNEIVLVLDQHLDIKKITSFNLARIEKARNQQKSLLPLHKDVHFRDNEKFAYGIDNFLYAAGHFQMTPEIYWIYPTETPLTMAQLGHIFWSNLELIADYGQQILSTFEYTSDSVKANINNMTVHMTTLDRILKRTFSKVVIDVDLDYFYNLDSKKLLKNFLTIALPQLKQLIEQNTLAAPLTFSYSCISGYLPQQFRWIGQKIADDLGVHLINQSYFQPPQSQFWLYITGEKTINKEIYEEAADYLTTFGGAGQSIQSLWALQLGLISKAINHYFLAREAQDYATIAAFKIALFFMKQKDYAIAEQWFERVQIQHIDSYQVRALSLQALCAFRQQHFSKSLQLARASIQKTPLREDGYLIASLASELIGQPKMAATYKKQLVKVRQKPRL